MRIEPVYLVSPPARASQPPTRRAFLLAGAAFAGGTLVGGACGYTVGVQLAAPAAEQKEKPDIRLKELRRLAVEAPVEELVSKWAEWFSSFATEYSDDPILWQGADRLAKWSLENQSATEPQLARMLVSLTFRDQRGEGSYIIQKKAELVELRRKRTK